MRFRLLLALSALVACADDAGPDPEPQPDGGAPLDGQVATPMDTSVVPDTAITLPDGAVPPTLNWTDCANKDFQCATLSVPLSYSDPNGKTTTLSLARLRATGQRIGSLVWNPGGPGSSAIDYLPILVAFMGPDVLARFDIVAMDPRGVGHSDPIICHGKLQALYAVDSEPDDDQEWAALDAVSAQFAQDCAGKYGTDFLGSVGTLNVARDLELLRTVLGDDKLHYLGLSYGTEIGAQYARLFPEHAGSLVLDGPVDLALSPIDLSLEQAKGFEKALANYFAWCTAQPSRCRWAEGVDPAVAFAALRAKVEQAPLPSSNWDRPCGPGELIQGVVAPLYEGEEGWKILSEDLGVAVEGDGTNLVINTDIYLQRDVDGNREYSNITEANYAVECLDAAPITLAQVRAQEATFKAAAPIFGVSSLSHLLVCAHWPATGSMPPVPSNVNTAPILVVGTTQDPATPYAWAQKMTADLGAAAHLLTYEGEGHTAYARGNDCIDSAVEAYLISGTLPAANARCSDAPATPLIHGGAKLAPKLKRHLSVRR